MLKRFAASAAAIAAVVSGLCPVSVRASDDAAALLAKHRAYVGWQFGDGTFHYLAIEGERTRAGSDGSKVAGRWTTVQAGLVFRTSGIGSIPGPANDYGFTGNVFWESDENGFTHPDYSDLRAFFVSKSVLLNEGTSQLTGTLVTPKEPAAGPAYPVVRVEPPYGDPIDLYVDPETGAYRRAVIDPQGAYETTLDIDAYADVLPGKRMISKYSYAKRGISDELRIQSVANIADEQFHPPAQNATWTFANPNPFRVDVKTHAVILDAVINGVRGRFILDTGASDIVVDGNFAARAHLTTVRQTHAYGFGGERSGVVTRADTVVVGENTLKNVTVTSIPDAFGQWDGENIDGLLGFPLFAGAVVTLDTGTQTMTISDPQTATIDKTGYPVTVDLSGGIPNVPMLIDGKVKVQSTLDFGSFATVLMSPDVVRDHHIPFAVNDTPPSDTNGNELAAERYYESHMTIQGIGGVSRQVSCATVQSIDLGPIHYQGTMACLDPDVADDSIVLGYEFLREFNYVFDYHDGLIVMRPHSQ